MVWGAPFQGEEVSEPHLELKASENQLSYRCFEEINRRQMTGGKISHLPWREGEPLARACPLGSELEWQPGTTFRSLLLSQWLKGVLDLCDLYCWKLRASIMGLSAGTWLAKYL